MRKFVHVARLEALSFARRNRVNSREIMQIGVPRERAAGESRVALTPDVVPQLVRAGHQILIERGAGDAAGFTDEEIGRLS